MKKILLCTLVSLCIHALHAQSDTVWRRGGGIILNFNQTSLTNWAAGGESNLSGTVLTNLFANYARGKTTWDNALVANYGVVTANNYSEVRKNDDKLELNSKYGRYAFDKTYYSFLLDFISQFANGYDYTVSSDIPISKFLAPGFLTAALGLNWKPYTQFSLFLSPATGKFTFVLDDNIDNTVVDSVLVKNRYGVNAGESVRTEFGALAIAELNLKVGNGGNFASKLTLFNNFTDPNTPNRKNVDVDWQNTLNIKLTKLFSAGIFTEVIYDQDIAIPIYDESNVQIGSGPRTQVKEVFGLGISYSFEGYGVR